MYAPCTYEFFFQNSRKIQFWNNFLNWIKNLYKKPICRLKTFEWILRTCEMKKGIRKVCPISTIRYLFVAEILSMKFKEKNQSC